MRYILIIKSTASLALMLTAPAFAEGYKPPQEPEPDYDKILELVE